MSIAAQELREGMPVIWRAPGFVSVLGVVRQSKAVNGIYFIEFDFGVSIVGEPEYLERYGFLSNLYEQFS